MPENVFVPQDGSTGLMATAAGQIGQASEFPKPTVGQSVLFTVSPWGLNFVDPTHVPSGTTIYIAEVKEIKTAKVTLE